MIDIGIAMADAHKPIHHEQAYETVMMFCDEIKPKHIMNLGDIGHFGGISHWNSLRYAMRQKYPVKKDIEGVRDHFTHQRKANPKSEIYFFEGNHEHWIYDYIENHPELKDWIDIDRDLGISSNNIIRVPREKQPMKLGKLRFIHGWFTNKYHAFKTGSQIHHNIVYAHAHDMQSFTSDNIETGQRFMSWSIGHLSDESKADYLKNRPTNWMLGFAIFYINRETGDFTFVPIALPKGYFYWNGKRYKA